MRRFILIAVNILLGISFFVGFLYAWNSAWDRFLSSIDFPIYAGEDDSEIRFYGVLFFLIPAFAVLGGWIGCTFARSFRAGVSMWLGAVIGSLIYVLILRVSAPLIRRLPNSNSANLAVFFSDGLLIACIVTGALVTRTIFVHKTL